MAAAGIRLASLGVGLVAALAALFLDPTARGLVTPVLEASVPTPTEPSPAPNQLPLDMAQASFFYIVRYDHWTQSDEQGFGEFLAGIGDFNCRTVNECLHGGGNPFRASDPPLLFFKSDCADLPYVLRAYYAWKRGLPFTYESAVEPRGRSRDMRYARFGNEVIERKDVLTNSATGYGLLETLRDNISSAQYRIPPDLEAPLEPDHYSPAIQPKSIRQGTLIYDPNGHVATVYRVDDDGRIHYLDAHPDNTLTRGLYDLRFVRTLPARGAGFKNWRPIRLVGYVRRADGALIGGHVVVARNAELADYSLEQYYGNGPHDWDDALWQMGGFRLDGELMDYYDYVRARLAGGRLEFDPVKEVADMVDSNCADLHYRADAVAVAIAAGIQNHPQPSRLPANIYGTEGDWETYSSPSRDARLKTAFKELRDWAQRFVEMYERGGDPHLHYTGNNLVADMLAAYDGRAGRCSIVYRRSNGTTVAVPYEEARRRLFAMSFDPYHCVEHRWGASDPTELATCSDGAVKRAWYAAEQHLRNQLDRTYEAQMDFDLDELREPGDGKGVLNPPDIDTRAYLLRVRGAGPGHPVYSAP